MQSHQRVDFDVAEIDRLADDLLVHLACRRDLDDDVTAHLRCAAETLTVEDRAAPGVVLFGRGPTGDRIVGRLDLPLGERPGCWDDLASPAQSATTARGVEVSTCLPCRIEHRCALIDGDRKS